MDYKELAVFLVIFYAALWAGSLIMGYIGSSVADPMLTAALATIVPGTILYYVWHKWGKKAVV